MSDLTASGISAPLDSKSYVLGSSERLIEGYLPVINARRGGIRFGPAEHPTWFTNTFGRDAMDVEVWHRRSTLEPWELGKRVSEAWDQAEGWCYLTEWDDLPAVQDRFLWAEMARCSCLPCSRAVAEYERESRLQ